MVARLLGGVVKLKPQTLRVLRVLERRPVTIADFDCQPACDGGDRITRLGARVHELKRAGFPVHGVRVKLGATHVQRYTLVTEPGEVMPNRANSADQGISVRGRDHQVRGAGCARAENADDLAWIQAASRWIHNRPALQQKPSFQDPPREGDAALTTVAESTKARGSGRAGTDRRRERNGTCEFARTSGVQLTGQSPSGADQLAGRLVDNPRWTEPSSPCDAVPASGSRTDAVSSSSSPAHISAGDARNGAHREDATGPNEPCETAGTPAPSISPAARASLPAGVIPVRAHTRRIHTEPAGPTLFDAAEYVFCWAVAA